MGVVPLNNDGGKGSAVRQWTVKSSEVLRIASEKIKVK